MLGPLVRSSIALQIQLPGKELPRFPWPTDLGQMLLRMRHRKSLNAKAELTELETQRTGTTVGEIKGSYKSTVLRNERPSEAAGQMKQEEGPGSSLN